MKIVKNISILGACCALAAGCASQSKDQDKSGGIGSTETSGDVLSDGQIAAILRTLNDAEIEAGELARTQAQSQPVRDFANMMVQDHTEANQRLAELTQRLNIVPADSEKTAKMREEHQDDMNELRKATGAELDKEYMEDMVDAHEEALEKFDKKLLPNAKNAELVNLLQELRPKIADHLQRAKTIKDSPMASN